MQEIVHYWYAFLAKLTWRRAKTNAGRHAISTDERIRGFPSHRFGATPDPLYMTRVVLWSWLEGLWKLPQVLECLIKHQNFTSRFPRETGTCVFFVGPGILGVRVASLDSENPLDLTRAQLQSGLQDQGYPNLWVWIHADFSVSPGTELWA